MSVLLILRRTALKKETKPHNLEICFYIKCWHISFGFLSYLTAGFACFRCNICSPVALSVFFLKNEPAVYLLCSLPNIKFCYKAALAQRWFESICCSRKAEWFVLLTVQHSSSIRSIKFTSDHIFLCCFDLCVFVLSAELSSTLQLPFFKIALCPYNSVYAHSLVKL